MASITMNNALIQILGRNPEPADYLDEKLMERVTKLMEGSELNMPVETRRTNLKPVKEIQITGIKETDDKPYIKNEGSVPKV
jgi:hypothetical protein